MSNQSPYFKPTPPSKKKSKVLIIVSIVIFFILVLLIVIILLVLKRQNLLTDKSAAETQAAYTQTAYASTLQQLSFKQAEIFTATAEGKAAATQAYLSAQQTLAFHETATQSAIVSVTQQFVQDISDRINQIITSQATYGPSSSTLILDNSGYVQDVQADASLKNFLVQADFYVPYSVEEGTWDIGFFFRLSEPGTGYRLIITSGGLFHLLTMQQNNRSDRYISDISNLNLEVDQVNQVMLLVEDSQGYLIVNDQLIKVLDLSHKPEAGDITAFSGAFYENIISGKTVKIENFTIWALP